jgi:hypothetical protein
MCAPALMGAALFLLPAPDTASRKLSIGCSLFLGQGQIFWRFLSYPALQPSHRVTRGRRCADSVAHANIQSTAA